jgi:ubiquinone biosynthesis protein
VLGKSFANIDGSVRYLTPEISVIDVFVDILDKIVLSLVREAASDVQRTRTLVDTLTAFQSAPAQMNDVLRDLANRETTYRLISHETTGSFLTQRRLDKWVPLAIAYLLWRTRRTS